MENPRIATGLADLYAIADLAKAGFGVEGPLWHNRASRLGSSRRTVADHWLLEHEGQAVSALLCYPLTFSHADGQPAEGFGLGAVTTHPDARRSGHAATLCRAAAEHAIAGGRRVGLLFSGIAPAYYERLGYNVCPAWSFRTTKLVELSTSGPRAELDPFNARWSVDTVAALYDQYHAGMLHLRRDAEAWQRSFTVQPEDWWFYVGGSSAPRGYVRCSVDRTTFDIAELVLTQPNDEAPVLRTLAAMAAELSLQTMRTWTRTSDFVQQWFSDKGREHTLPMVLGTEASGASQFWDSDYF